MSETEQALEIPGLRRLKLAIPYAWRVIMVFVFIGLCMLLNNIVPWLLDRVVAAASTMGLGASQQGFVAYVVFDVVPLMLFGAALFITGRVFEDDDDVWVARLPFFALVFTLPLNGEEAASALPPRGVLMEDRLGDWTVLLGIGAIACWAAYRGVRWLIDDERRARQKAGA